VLFFVGLIIAIIRLVHEDSPPGLWGVTSISVVQISAADWTVGLFQGAIPQVPTTLLNSCIAVCKLAEDLYPHRETGCNVRSVSVSVGLLNVVLCWFGALPICHGSGGLAGQHRFGARTNLSVLVLGALKLVLGLFFAPALLVTLRYFPTSILAAMLAISAFELASAARSALTQVCFFFCTHVYATLAHTHTCHTHTLSLSLIHTPHPTPATGRGQSAVVSAHVLLHPLLWHCRWISARSCCRVALGSHVPPHRPRGVCGESAHTLAHVLKSTLYGDLHRQCTRALTFQNLRQGKIGGHSCSTFARLASPVLLVMPMHEMFRVDGLGFRVPVQGLRLA
jgi:hypothetical protein